MNEETIFFSIIVVALNPGDKLQKTIDSILEQDYKSYEIVVKDGVSRDGSVEALEREYGTNSCLKVIRRPDRSIYDAMNQALEAVKGDYVLFLNCGDTFYGRNVLAGTADTIAAVTGEEEAAGTWVFYGNTFCEQTGATVHSSPEITGFTCYRNIPCHQSCFYDRRLFQEKKYNTEYRIRADYDHFLWCFYRAGAAMRYMDRIVAAYEGGGYSESKENRARDREEHRMITGKYMGKGELMRYRAVMMLTLVPLRRWMAENSVLSGFYHWIKDMLYKRGGRRDMR